ncbi:MAG: hypothetical protein KAS07_03470 [Candidatus Pacebacteria bacterium]|nr:hypothetical protein [Candidatus Paceibacterota bacterium]
MAIQIGGMIPIYHHSKVCFEGTFGDSKASEIWDKIKKHRNFFSKKRNKQCARRESYLRDFGGFEICVSNDSHDLSYGYERLTVKFKQMLGINLVEMHLKNLRTGTPGESYVLKRISYNDTEALRLLGSIDLGGFQKDRNPGYIYAAEFQVAKNGNLTVLVYCKYAIKILCDFCKEANLNIHTQ